MRYWIEVRWPSIPEDRQDLLYFHQGRSLSRGKTMRDGDQVLYYETLKPRAGTRERGSGTIYAHAIVGGAITKRPPAEVGVVEGRVFDHSRPARVVRALRPGMKHCGVPLPRVREVLNNRPMYCMEITQEQFRTLAAELEDTCR